MTTMEKTYQPHAIEQHWYLLWEQKNYFAPQGSGFPFCIMMPPPNVTGSLHMGHGFGYTLMDTLTRYHRMMGDKTLWQPGTDHAGIATQMVVEQQLLGSGQARQDLGRESFVKKIWEWKNESGNRITQQLRRLGASPDWQRERFTMDKGLSHAVQEVFIRLYNEGLIYRGTRLVNWDPKLLTAVSDLEVESEEEEGKLYHIRYPLIDSNQFIIVATTRPETLLGDVAVAVHPDDERYQQLIGKSVQLPLTTRMIPVIADEFVDRTFGSGCVKITPAHDFNDYEVGLRHQLTPLNIFTVDARLNQHTPEHYRGLDRFAAREQLIKDLERQGLLEKIEKHLMKVPRGSRSGEIIEPYLTQQWFMKMKPLAKPAIEAVEKGKIRFIPENWSKTYFQWMHNIEDWCISRQLWWGHQIPVWYDVHNHPYVGHDEEDIRSRYQLKPDVILRQDEDVLDTWFSAALWPFSTLGWPTITPELTTFYPTSLLVTGFDIIFFWVARMIMMGLKFMEEVPFRDVFITGLIRDAEGQKMSKSKGNALDPLDLIDGVDLDTLIQKRIYGLMQPGMAKKIEQTTRKHFPDGIAAYGTDALRFTFCSFASYGREIRFDVARLEGYRNFCNKLWNAARYVMMNTEGKDTGISSAPKTLSEADQWILSRLQHTINEVHGAFTQYRFDLLAQALYEFTWNEFCDWYLELSKPVLTSENSTEQQLRGTRYTLVTVLEVLLRLMHPVMPFITEEIWQRIALLAGKTGETIMLQPYPHVDLALRNENIEAELDWVKNIIVSIRTIRSEMNIAPSKALPVLLSKGSEQDQKRVHHFQPLIQTLAKLQSLRWLTEDKARPQASTALVGSLEILIPLVGVIDIKEESVRLNKEIAKLIKEIARAEMKLQNPAFVDKAPAEIVAKERVKLTELENIKNKFQTQLKELATRSDKE
jgi:valyl-tRNA synthetase